MAGDEKVKILIVDDVPGKRLAIEAALAEMDEQVVAVSSGVEALRHLLTDEFAVILLDVNMPDMDGYETASLIRQRPRFEHTPIIFITAFGDEMHAAQGYSLGAVDYIQSPVIPSVLRTKVKVFVELYRKNLEITRQAQQKIALVEAEAALAAAERSSQAKSAFLATISHELRTPMNAIIGMTQLTLDENLTPTARENLNIVQNSAQVLLDLLNEILDFSRLEAGRFPLSVAPFSLRQTLDGTMKSLAVRAFERGLDFLCTLPHDMPDEFEGDALRLRQVLVNLIGNAIKFTDQGEVLVNVELESATPEQAVLRFSVTDTGIGVSAADMQKIFAPFTQADSSSTRVHGGTGLGLSIASSLINLMGGRLWVESELGLGSIFHFVVSLATRKQTISAAWEEESRLLRNLPILVVEEHPATREYLSKVLAAWGARPVAMGDVLGALDRIRQAQDAGQPFALWIVDAGLAGSSAFDLAMVGGINDIVAKPAMLTVASADRDVVARRDSHPESCLYIEKPISQLEIRRAIGQALRGERPPAAMAPLQPALQPPPPLGPSLRVLVVDDTPANQKLVRSILERRNHTIDSAENGRRALDMVQAGDYDIILMDVQMPVMDGLEATREIRKLAFPKSQVPIVAMTAHAMRGDDGRCLAAGMNAYLPKPIHRDGLIQIIEELGRATEVNRSATLAGG